MLPNYSTKKVLIGDAKTEQFSDIGFIRTGAATSNQRSGRPNSFYAVLVNPENSMVVGAEKPPDIQDQDFPKDRTSEGFLRIYPISPDGTERVWRRSYEKCLIEIEQGNLLCSNGRTLKLKKSNANKFRPIFSNWIDKKYNAGVYGTNLLKDVLGKTSFSYPKSIYNVMDCLSASTKIVKDACILDFFAGSGTTGHAIINLNRQDSKKRKYILVEVGHHFNDVILPRIKKVIYSDQWKNGKPVSRNGTSQFVKYIEIESYEDTLDGLEFVPTDDDLLNQIPSLAEDFKLRYALVAETSQSASLLGDHFSDPFAYTLSVVRDGERREVSVDLPETFNYLIGLRTKARRMVDEVLAITGRDSFGQNCLILWRNLDKTNNTKLESWLDLHLNTFNSEFDRLYANGDHTLNAKRGNQKWVAESIEPVFRSLMFDVENETI